MATNEMTWINYSGVLTNTKLNKTIRKVAQPLMKFAQFVDVKDAFGKSSGEAVNWPKVGNIGTYGGAIVETNTMHESTPSISWGTATVTEYGNAIPWTFKSEALSQLDIEEIIRSGLADDYAKCMDGLVERQFAGTKLKYSATSTAAGTLTTNGTFTVATNTGAITGYHLRTMAFHLKKRNVPGYTRLGGKYAGILSAAAVNNIRGGLVETTGISQILGTETGAKMLMNGEVGELHGIRIVEDTFATMFNYDPSARTATSKVANASGRTLDFAQATQWTGASEAYEAYIFGSPAVMEIVAVPLEIRKKIPTDYGRSKGIAWYTIVGHKIMWDSNDSADDHRIIHFSNL